MSFTAAALSFSGKEALGQACAARARFSNLNDCATLVASLDWSLIIVWNSSSSIPSNAKNPRVTFAVIYPNMRRRNTITREKVLQVHNRLRRGPIVNRYHNIQNADAASGDCSQCGGGIAKRTWDRRGNMGHGAMGVDNTSADWSHKVCH